MASLVLACPACGQRTTCDSEHFGDRVRCKCGMTFTASPVFAVTPWRTAFSHVTRSKLSFVTAAVLLAASGGLAAWLLHKPRPTPTVETPAVVQAPTVIEAPLANEVPPPPVEPPKPAPVEEAKPEPKPAPKPPPPPDLPPAIKVSPVKLFDAFDDPDKASVKFEGQWVELTGPAKLERDEEGRPYRGYVVVAPRKLSQAQLTKLDPRTRGWEEKGYPPNIRCYFPDENDALKERSAGEPAVIRGIVRRRDADEDVYMGYVVVVEDCRWVK